MSASPTDAPTCALPTQSDMSITAETVPDTVMAEQIGQNVVDNSESTSAQPLVDVSAAQTTFASADAGTLEQPLPETKTDALQTSQLANDYATDSNAHASSVVTGPNTTDPIADPSAGDATSEVAQAHAAALEQDPSDKTTTDAQLVNGTYSTASAGDANAEDTNSVDVSVNSDAEGSRGDASKDDKHHERTNSVKKPTTFSKVSVTKNFLAKSATAVPVVAKPGEKPSPVGTPSQSLNSALKPRLIAKTGASIRDVQKTRMGSDGAGGPDASKVWNKNRRTFLEYGEIENWRANGIPAVAPPPPRQFTDEELKQQYGIHLATRLQTDENGKESKWADIDDDEDDWAPDTVVWMDGTKSNLTPQEAAPMLKEQKPASPVPPTGPEGTRPTLAMKKPTELGPTKTILKPGANAAAVLAQRSGSPSGTLAEKSALKTKSPAPAPAKSPWAPLPPVDKISPIIPPVQQHPPPPSFATQDARAYDQALPPPPAREIAADTFDRSWREGEGGARELFNSANGRYEPVTEGRRGSIKPDASQRKPAVLQRPGVAAAAPAEPSAAFQTRSTTQSDASWGRRRGSSVSQGSIPPVRRMSISKGQEMSMSPVSDRRPSTVVGHDMRSSPKVGRNEPAQPPAFSQQSAWQQQMPPRPEPAPEAEDPVKVQERIMKEKREEAKKRREEEEARLEQEKQERLKARLASFEGVGKSRAEREAEKAAAAGSKAVETPSSEKPLEPAVPAPTVESARAQPSEPTEVAAMAAPAFEAQSLPPAPEEARAQQPAPGEVLPSPLPPKPQAPQQPAGLPDRTVTSADQIQRQLPRPHLSPRSNARAPFHQQSAAYRAPTSSYSSPGERKPQPFGRSPLPNNEAFSTPWPTEAPNANVWGNSGIGNGTFGSANVFAPMPMSQQSSSLPPPPGMNRPASARISPQQMAHDSRSPSLQPQSMGDAHRGFAPPGFDARPDPFAGQGRNNGPSPAGAPGLGRPPHAPGPIAPPSRSQQQPIAPANDKAAVWRAAAQDLPNQFTSDVAAAAVRVPDAVPIPQDTIKETFKMTTGSQGRLGGPRKTDKTVYTIHDSHGSRSVETLSPAPPSAQTQPSGPFSVASPSQQDSWRQPGENTVRIPDGSLNPAHGGMAAAQPPIGPPTAQQTPFANYNYMTQAQHPSASLAATMSDDQSPPPPETSSHPVNDGDASHPRVRFPRGKPVVKLPPAPIQAQSYMSPPNTVMLPQRPISNVGAPATARPIAMNEAWQARFNGLFNRTPIQTETPPSPPKTPPKMQGPALAVTSSSRAVMDDSTPATGPVVSFPQAKNASGWSEFVVDDSDDVMSKPVIEPMFTEELSFGSKPIITVPRNARYNDRVYQTLPLAMMRPNPRANAPGDAYSKGALNMLEIHPRRYEGVFVSLPLARPIRRVIRRPHQDGRKPSGVHHQQERKPSGKFAKGKGMSTGTGEAPNAALRKPSAQNVPATASPAPLAESTLAAMDGGRKYAPKRAHPRKPKDVV